MVKEVYSADQLTQLKTEQKKYTRICVLTAVLLAAVCVFLCFLVNRNNAQIIQLGNIVLCTVAGWFVLYLLRNRLQPTQSRIKHFDIWRYGPREQFTGTVLKIEEPVTLQRNVKAYPVIIQGENGNVQLWWDVNQELPDFGQGSVRFQTVRHQIVAYEVMP